jgi:D-beta-D-heptose 7-phosphate kinase/D-beta-D-heptose 1-phosphate adenosyltransferase
VPVLVDPKKPDYRSYAGATCVTPNYPEFQHALLTMALPRGGLAESGHRLREAIGSDFLLVTQGAEGMTLFRADGQSRHLAALAQEVFDISGAGDTVIATLAASVGAGLDIENAMGLANAAASIVVAKVGTAPVQWEDLARLLEKHDTPLAAPVAGDSE